MSLVIKTVITKEELIAYVDHLHLFVRCLGPIL
jgi:hypothetical protein